MEWRFIYEEVYFNNIIKSSDIRIVELDKTQKLFKEYIRILNNNYLIDDIQLTYIKINHFLDFSLLSNDKKTSSEKYYAIENKMTSDFIIQGKSFLNLKIMYLDNVKPENKLLVKKHDEMKSFYSSIISLLDEINLIQKDYNNGLYIVINMMN